MCHENRKQVMDMLKNGAMREQNDYLTSNPSVTDGLKHFHLRKGCRNR